jgi:hypothetical protein
LVRPVTVYEYTRPVLTATVVKPLFGPVEETSTRYPIASAASSICGCAHDRVATPLPGTALSASGARPGSVGTTDTTAVTPLAFRFVTADTRKKTRVPLDKPVTVYVVSVLPVFAVSTVHVELSVDCSIS